MLFTANFDQKWLMCENMMYVGFSKQSKIFAELQPQKHNHATNSKWFVRI